MLGDPSLNVRLEANEDRPQARLQLARIAITKQQADLAFSHALTATKFDSFNSIVYYEAAVILASGAHLESAQVLLSSAPREARADGQIDYAEGLIWAEREDIARSLASLQAAVSKNPIQERWWYNLVAAQMKTGDRKGAQESLEKALSKLPSSNLLESLATLR